MRIVVDTDVLVSALLWQGSPHRLLEHARNGGATLFTRPALLTERLSSAAGGPRSGMAVGCSELLELPIAQLPLNERTYEPYQSRRYDPD